MTDQDHNQAKATAPQEIERQVMSALVPKNEREWWAQREIEALRISLDGTRKALVKIQKLAAQFDEDDHAYNDVDTLQVFENSVSDIVELALDKNGS